jgi:hypothetical protein
MKKLVKILALSSLLLSTGITSSCDTLAQLPINLGNLEPTDGEIGSGLKEALNVGINKGVQQLIKTDGYFGNQVLKILLPPEAQNVQNIITKYVPGGQDLINGAVLKMNRAAEEAAKEAVPIFTNAITGMSFTDARNILFGGNGSATTYLKNVTTQSLISAYSPKINASLESVGARQAWEALVKPYNKFANSPAAMLVNGAKPINPDLTAYVTQKALDGLFYKVNEGENDIRGNLGARSSQLLQKVFGSITSK